ncbi:MAG TPA: glutathione S-transferase, partial [Hyphomonadaceae bacterium]|nr:glutathione S-transferase [Hyphomonadaceae bacterium]
MDLGRDHKPRKVLSDGVCAEIARMKIGWGMALHRSDGPFLFGDWSIADAFYS